MRRRHTGATAINLCAIGRPRTDTDSRGHDIDLGTTIAAIPEGIVDCSGTAKWFSQSSRFAIEILKRGNRDHLGIGGHRTRYRLPIVSRCHDHRGTATDQITNSLMQSRRIDSAYSWIGIVGGQTQIGCPNFWMPGNRFERAN